MRRKKSVLHYEIRPIVTQIDGVEEKGFRVTITNKKVTDIGLLSLSLLSGMAERGDRGFVIPDDLGCLIITQDLDEDFVKWNVTSWAEKLGFSLFDSTPARVDADLTLPSAEIDVLILLDEEDGYLCMFFGADFRLNFLFDAYRWLQAEYEKLYVFSPEVKSEEPYLYAFVESLDVYNRSLSFWETAHQELDKLKNNLYKWAAKRGFVINVTLDELEVTAEELARQKAARAEKEAALVLQARALLEKLGLRLEGEHPVNRIKALLSLFYRNLLETEPDDRINSLLNAFDRLDEIEDENEEDMSGREREETLA